MPKVYPRDHHRDKYAIFVKNAHSFLVLYFERANIHGFAYFGLQYLVWVEKLFWLVLVTVSFCATVILSLQSLNRYQTKSTVVSIERDHYYWNTTLPAFTICPIRNRIDQGLFDQYCLNNNINGKEKTEFFEFIESMANATYDTFDEIKDYKSVQRLNIDPNDYMMLIYNLTLDQIRKVEGEKKIRAFRNQDHIRCEQILTEQGICYTSNSFLAANLSTKWLLLGTEPVPLQSLKFYQNNYYFDVISGNLFDGDKSYSMVGFTKAVTIYIHSPFEAMDIAKMKYYATNYHEFLSSSIEMVAHENFQRYTTISQRQCRFNSESNLTHYAIYTRGLCLQECRMELVYKLCGCIPHFYPNRVRNPKPVCSYQSLKECVAPKKKFLLELRTVEYGRVKTVDCDCLQNCVDSDVFINQHKPLVDTNQLLGTIGGVIIVREYPLLRYKRRILFSLTDLFVSIGGTASFFTGFCVLGIIEIVYFFTVRLFWHIMGRRINPVELTGPKHGLGKHK